MSIPVWIPQLMLALMILVTWHELGHFLPAKWFKTQVDRFVIFFDPWWTPIEKKIGETTYGIGWLPMGGYVKIAGMIDESMDTEFLDKDPEPWEFRAKPAWQRFIIMIGGIFMNVILSFFLFGIVFWVWGSSYLPTENAKYGMHYSETMKKFGFQEGDLILKVGDQAQDKIDPASFMKAVILSDAKKVIVRRAGEDVTLTLPENIAGELTNSSVNKGSLIGVRFPFVLDSILPDSPAEKAGLQKSDKILTLDGKSAEYFGDFSTLANTLSGKTVAISYERAGQIDTTNITLTEAGKIGVGPLSAASFMDFKKETFGFGESMVRGYKESWSFLGSQVQAFGQMFKGKIKASENLGSVISIGKMFGNEWQWEKFWTITASLSMLLAFINLLPIPGLDGGYVLFLIWEMVTGRKVSEKFMEKAVTVGFFLLMGLMIYALGLDIWRHYIR